jgi:malonyl CoA-acyl carrier protein transacylase
LDEETVLGICTDSGAEVANFNAPTQTVVGGTPEATEGACRLAKERGGRGIPVKVSGAFHTSLMAPAAEAFSRVVGTAPIDNPQITVIGNVSSQSLANADDVRGDLASQIRSPVRWYQSVDFMAQGGVTRVMEIGPGQILTNQLKRSHPALEYYPWDEPGR